eukprot:scaffold15514_cov129-Cylindrotheca_fusiformis.AAC.17
MTIQYVCAPQKAGNPVLGRIMTGLPVNDPWFTMKMAIKKLEDATRYVSATVETHQRNVWKVTSEISRERNQE